MMMRKMQGQLTLVLHPCLFLILWRRCFRATAGDGMDEGEEEEGQEDDEEEEEDAGGNEQDVEEGDSDDEEEEGAGRRRAKPAASRGQAGMSTHERRMARLQVGWVWGVGAHASGCDDGLLLPQRSILGWLCDDFWVACCPA